MKEKADGRMCPISLLSGCNTERMEGWRDGWWDMKCSDETYMQARGVLICGIVCLQRMIDARGGIAWDDTEKPCRLDRRFKGCVYAFV